MLKKRSRSQHKDEVSGQKQKNNSFFNVPGLFVGFNPKVSESDSVRSPTSPLDFRLFSNFSKPFRSPRLYNEGHQKSWDNNKVGLSIIDSLVDETSQSGKVLRSCGSGNILFGPQMRIKNPNFNSLQAPKSLPKNIAIFPYNNNNHLKPSNLQKGNSDVLFEIGEGSSEIGKIRSCSLDSGRSSSRLINFAQGNKSRLSSGNFDNQNPSIGFIKEGFEIGVGSGSKLSEIELSEDYTCVRKNGKITHIFCDCVLECHGNELTNFSKNNKDINALPEEVKYPSADFLSFCYSCKKKLDGEDIYMYRGEKAFCSSNCRSEEISNDDDEDSDEGHFGNLPHHP